MPTKLPTEEVLTEEPGDSPASDREELNRDAQLRQLTERLTSAKGRIFELEIRLDALETRLADEHVFPQEQAVPNESGYVRKHEAARILGVCLRTVENAIQNGVLPAFKVGKKMVFLRRSDLPNFYAQGSGQ